MKTADIAALLVAGMQQQGNGNTDIGWHTGVVQAWDEQTGLNSILINGNTFNNLSVLSTSNSIMITAGDTVALMRVQSQYFILGRVQAPGAGAALRIQHARVVAEEGTTTDAWVDLATPGPVISNVYVGSSRRCLILMSVSCNVNDTSALAGVQVTGASTIAPNQSAATWLGGSGTAVTLGASASSHLVLTEADGLNQGFHTFTMKYRRYLGNVANSAIFKDRKLTVFPF